MKTIQFTPRDWIRNHPILARIWHGLVPLVVMPLIFLPVCLFETYRHRTGGFWAQFVHEAKYGLNVWKEMFKENYCRWEFLDE